MSSIVGQVAQFRDFLLFAEILDDLSSDSATYKTTLWTPEITVYNSALLVEEFVDSRQEKMPAFFVHHMHAVHGNNRRSRLRYCFRLYLSLVKFAKEFQGANVYLTLFSTQTDLPVYNTFWQTRNLIIQLKGELRTHNSDLERMFICERQWQYVLRCIFNFNIDQIQDFEGEMAAAVLDIKRDKRLRTRVYKYCRNDEYSAAFFLEHIMNKFYQIYAEAQVRSVQGLEPAERLSEGGPGSLSQKELKPRGSIKRDDGTKAYVSERLSQPAKPQQSSSFAKRPSYEVDTPSLKGLDREALKSKVSSIIQKASDIGDHTLPQSEYDAVQVEIFKSKLSERDRLLDQLRDINRERTAFRLTTANLISTLQKTDETISAVKGKMAKIRTALGHYAPKPIEDESMNFLLPDEHSHGLITNHAQALKEAIRRTNPDTYEALRTRIQERLPRFNGLTERLKKRILDPDFQLVVPEDYEFEVQEFESVARSEFGHLRALDDESLLILNTFVNNMPRDQAYHSSEVRVGDTFIQTAENLIRVLGGLLVGQHSDKETEGADELQTYTNHQITDMAPSIDLNTHVITPHASLNVDLGVLEPEPTSTDMIPKPEASLTDSYRFNKERFAFLKDPYYDVAIFSQKTGLSSRSRLAPRTPKAAGLSKTAAAQLADDHKPAIGEKKFSFADIAATQAKQKFSPDELLGTFAGMTNREVHASSNQSGFKTVHQPEEGKYLLNMGGPLVIDKKPSINVFVESEQAIDRVQSQIHDSLSDGRQSMAGMPGDNARRDRGGTPNDPNSTREIPAHHQLSFRSRNHEPVEDRQVSKGLEVRGKKASILGTVMSTITDEREHILSPNSLRDIAGSFKDYNMAIVEPKRTSDRALDSGLRLSGKGFPLKANDKITDSVRSKQAPGDNSSPNSAKFPKSQPFDEFDLISGPEVFDVS